MKWKRLGRDYVFFILLIVPLPFIGMLNVSTTVRLLLLTPIIILQGLFIWSAMRRDREGR